VLAQQAHAQHFGVKGNRAIQMAYPDHGVKDSHGFTD
jgi:hypothetical protein